MDRTLLELSCKHNVHGHPDKVFVDVIGNKIMLVTSRMSRYYVTSIAQMNIEEATRLHCVLFEAIRIAKEK